MSKTPQIGPHIRDLRKQKKLTLDSLSERSGVSKSILSELERSKGNPTFATLWSIANALGVNLSELTDQASEVVHSSLEVIQAHFIPEIKSGDGHCILRILGPAKMIGSMEWYEISIAPGGSLKSLPHTRGTWEHLTATAGRFNIVAGGISGQVEKGGTIRYPADCQHEIHNQGKDQATGFLVVVNT